LPAIYNYSNLFIGTRTSDGVLCLPLYNTVDGYAMHAHCHITVIFNIALLYVSDSVAFFQSEGYTP